MGLIFSRTPLTEQSLPRDDVTGAGFRLFQESPDLHWEISPGSGRVLTVNMKAGIPSSSLCLTQLALGLQSLNPQGRELEAVLSIVYTQIGTQHLFGRTQDH